MRPDDRGHAFEIDAEAPRPRLECEALLAAVLERSLLDLLGDREDLTADAAAWLFDPPTLGKVGFTLDDVANGLGFDPDRLRARLRGIRQRTQRSRSTSVAGRLRAAA